MPAMAALLALAATAAIQQYATPTRIQPASAERAADEARRDNAATPAEREVVAAKVDRHSRLTVPVEIEGHGPFRFMVDTGAQRTVLSASLARQLGLRDGPQMRVVGIVQETRVPSARIDSLDLGRLSLADMQVPLLEGAHIGADGIIGTDTLQDQRVLLDFEGERIEVGDSDVLGGNKGYEIVVRARRQSGQLIMTSARIDGVPVAVVLDTGAQASVGNRALQAALGRRGAQFAPVLIESVTGHSLLAEVGAAKTLTVNEIVINNPVIAFTDTPAFRELGLERKPALFLGMREMSVFRRVAIDFAARRVLFDLPASL